MEKNGLLPFAYSSQSENQPISLNTAPRERHVIDENAGSLYHTRVSQPAGNGAKSGAKSAFSRPKGPTLTAVPSIKRKMGESFYENDDKKRQDTNPVSGVQSHGPMAYPGSFATGISASAASSDSDPATDVTEPDGDFEDYPELFLHPAASNLPSSPPQLNPSSEYDVSVHDYPVPESPVNRRHHVTLNTLPVKKGSRAAPHSSEPDFGIDAFNRFRVSFRDTCPSTDNDDIGEASADAGPPIASETALFAAARNIILRSFEDVRATVSLEGMNLTEIPDEVKDLNNLVIFDAGPSQVLRQLYLLDNQIQVLNPCLFKFTKLNVLSLRRNRIRYLPNSIGKLRNLTDLNVSINKLTYLPPQILHLPNLTTFRAGPNPFLPVPDNAVEVDGEPTGHYKVMKWVSPVRLRANKRATATLKAICLDAVGKYDVSYSETKRWKKTIPKHLQPLVALAISKAKFLDLCEKCPMIVVEPYADVVEWWDILQNSDVPIKRKFCSGRCLQKYQLENKYAQVKDGDLS